MAGIDYEPHDLMDPRKAPKHKLPYIVDGATGVGDSDLIIDHIIAKEGDRLNEQLSAQERAVALAMQRLMEEHLYWCFVQLKWMRPEYWQESYRTFFAGLPFPLRLFVPSMARKQAAKQLYQQGVGRHSDAEIDRMAVADLTALSVFLGDKPYFLGREPTRLDAVAYGSLSVILLTPYDWPFKDELAALSNLESFCLRMKERYYGDAT